MATEFLNYGCKIQRNYWYCKYVVIYDYKTLDTNNDITIDGTTDTDKDELELLIPILLLFGSKDFAYQIISILMVEMYGQHFRSW
jgi:hypothetical protein